MAGNLQEQTCWVTLAFESDLSPGIINGIVVTWCLQLGRTLEDFFDANPQEWKDTCHLNSAIIEKLEQAREKRVGQAFLIEQLSHESISVLTVLDDNYPKLLKSSLKPNQLPPVLFYAGDLHILDLTTIAIIGSRNASETSLTFTREVARYLAEQGANVISGYARGVDRAAYEGAISTVGCTTVVLPHGIHKLSRVQMQGLLPKIEAGNVLLLSQFHSDAAWLVSRAMERNKVVTGLAQVVIVAESDVQGGTWAGATGALRRKLPVYVRQTRSSPVLQGNEALIELGGHPLHWPTDSLPTLLAPLFQKSTALHEERKEIPAPPDQFSLFTSNE